jgi:hypothetical protein
MMLLRLRGALSAHPRSILAVLLAFAIEVLPLGSGVVSHRHAGGVFPLAQAAPIAGVAAAATPGDGEGTFVVRVERAPARDLHRHVVPLLVAMRGPATVPPGPALFTTNLPAAPVPAEISAARRVGQARAPPFLPA